MWTLLSLFASLLTAQAICARRAKRETQHMMRSGDLWEAEDLDRWLELIEPFPLGDTTPREV